MMMKNEIGAGLPKEPFQLKRNKKASKIALMRKNYDLYLMLIPGLVFLLIFKYIPMYGVVIGFQDFNIFKGVFASQWVGLANFEKLFQSQEFYTVFRNTLLISVYRLMFTFSLPIIIALMLNEIRGKFFKRSVQTLIYMPHFLSWVVVAGVFINILSANGGAVNNIIEFFGGDPINFFSSKQWFRTIVIVSGAWKEAGWSAIIYIAAIAGVDQELYEAAEIDGAGRFRKIISITLPSIASTIILMLILKLGHILDVGTEQILVLYNPVVYEVGDVIGTYVYRMGIGKMDYSFSTAVGLFNSVVGLILILGGNYMSKKLLDKSIW